MASIKNHIVLVQPDIPWNTGAIGRTCVALDAELILIHPLGFSLDEKGIRRAGMDYWPHVQLAEYDSWDAFITDRNIAPEQLVFFEEFGEKTYYEADFTTSNYLVFGSETTGLPSTMVEQYKHRLYKLPMQSPHIRSLNLANTATAAIFEALRQQGVK